MTNATDTGAPRALPVLAAAAAAAVLAATSLSLRHATRLRAIWPPEADALYMPPSSALRRVALGHTELAADLVSARANVYFGTQFLSKAPQRWLDRYLHTAIDLDPHFHSIYLNGAATLVYDGTEPSAEKIERANQILERGVAMFPYDWELHFQLGFNYYKELPTLRPGSPQIEEWQARGIASLERASLFESAPPWLPNLVARAMSRHGDEALAIRHLERAYAVAVSEEARSNIRGKLLHLRSAHVVEELAEAQRQFDDWIGGTYPYAPEAFSVVAGPRVPPGVDPKAER